MLNAFKKKCPIGLPATVLTITVLVLAGCSTSGGHAPIVDRSSNPTISSPASSPSASATTNNAPNKANMGTENAGKPGYYTVEAGDTIFSIGRKLNISPRSIAQWNNIENSNVIEIGQILRVVPPVGAGTLSTTSPLASNSGENKANAGSIGEVNLMWPSAGKVADGFNDPKNKGINIAGSTGDPVFAAADGIVAISNRTRGYGNLLVIKHTDTVLTAYAYNQKLLVKENQRVKKGQKIAEMGNIDSEGGAVKLHFEVRRNGAAVDPVKYLPPR